MLSLLDALEAVRTGRKNSARPPPTSFSKQKAVRAN
jgi:hypothetical protein